MKETNEKSKCCNKPKVSNYSDEGTGCFLCSGCLREFIPTQEPMEWESEWKLLIEDTGNWTDSDRGEQGLDFGVAERFISSQIKQAEERGQKKAVEMMKESFKEHCFMTDDGLCKYWRRFQEDDEPTDKYFPNRILEDILLIFHK